MVVRSSRTNGGIIRRNIELNDDQLGHRGVDGAQPGQGACCCSWRCSKTKDPKVIQGYFDRY